MEGSALSERFSGVATGTVLRNGAEFGVLQRISMLNW
jgi:hypothetical protein